MTLRVSDSVEKKHKKLEGRQRDRDKGVYPAIVIAEGFASLKRMSVSGAVRKRDVCKAPLPSFGMPKMANSTSFIVILTETSAGSTP